MKFFALFIYRPVATILISLAITLCGVLGFRLLPVAPLPQVDFPVIMISASLPGASPETMASSVATPLERLPRPDRRRVGNDLHQFAGQHAHYYGVQFRPRY